MGLLFLETFPWSYYFFRNLSQDTLYFQKTFSVNTMCLESVSLSSLSLSFSGKKKQQTMDLSKSKTKAFAQEINEIPFHKAKC